MNSKEQGNKSPLVVDEKTLKRFYYLTSGNTLTRITSQEGTAKEKYKRWQEKVGEISKECFVCEKRKRKPRNMLIRKLMAERRWLRAKLKERGTVGEKNNIIHHCKKIDKKIISEREKVIGKNVIDEVEKISRSGGINSGAFWEFKKKMDPKKKEKPHAMKDKDGKIKITKEEIKDEFKKFYSDLFQQAEIVDKTSKEMLEIKMKSLEILAKTKIHQVKEITREEVAVSIKRLKNKRTPDRQGISNVMVKSGGSDLVNSTTMIFNEISKQQEAPSEWVDMMINTIYKGKGDKMDFENRRGLFITNTISKLYDSIKLSRNDEKLSNGITKFQCGSMKGKSTVDHIMTLNAILDYNSFIGSETYTIFADAYKCFDKLVLKDCVSDMWRIVGPVDAYEMYKMNAKGRVCLKTPVGEVEGIVANEIVRQGTIPGPKLCCVNTDQINRIGRKCITYIGPRIKVETLGYVDDLQNSSSNTRNLQNCVSNLRLFEDTKGYTFSVDKKKTAVLITGKKKNKEYDVSKLQVKRGCISLATEYKYLGQWYNEKGDHSTMIGKIEEKQGFYIQQIKHYGNEFKIGDYALPTRLKIYNVVVVPTAFHNIETWSRISKTELERLEAIQSRIVRAICGQIKSTPYFGLLAEIGLWPVEQQIHYRKVLLYYNIRTSREGRLVKEIVEDQVKNPWKGCWIEGLNEILMMYDLDKEELLKWSKQKCKEEVKERIQSGLQKRLDSLRGEKTKLRFIKTYGKKEYLESGFKSSVTLIKARLNMVEVKCNFKGNYGKNLKCVLCKLKDDTTEHLFECSKLSELQNVYRAGI